MQVSKIHTEWCHEQRKLHKRDAAAECTVEHFQKDDVSAFHVGVTCVTREMMKLINVTLAAQQYFNLPPGDFDEAPAPSRNLWE